MRRPEVKSVTREVTGIRSGMRLAQRPAAVKGRPVQAVASQASRSRVLPLTGGFYPEGHRVCAGARPQTHLMRRKNDAG